MSNGNKRHLDFGIGCPVSIHLGNSQRLGRTLEVAPLGSMVVVAAEEEEGEAVSDGHEPETRAPDILVGEEVVEVHSGSIPEQPMPLVQYIPDTQRFHIVDTAQ